MDYAKDRRGSEKLIRADDAFPGRYYTCPTCFAEVYLRRGRWRAAHFAHRSGQGKPDCENFHPSDPLTYTWHGGGGGSALVISLLHCLMQFLSTSQTMEKRNNFAGYSGWR
jgi:hypothetical protein